MRHRNFGLSVAHLLHMRHRKSDFCGAHGPMRHRKSTRGALSNLKKNSVAHLPGAPQKVDILWRTKLGAPQNFFSNPTLWIAFFVLQEKNENDKNFKK